MEFASTLFSEKFTLFQAICYLVGTYFAVCLGLKLLKIPKAILNHIQHKRLVARAQVHRRQALENIQKARDLLPKNTLSAALQEEILNADVTKLKTMLESNKVTSVQLLTFYYDRCLKFNPEFNFLTTENIQEALKLAQQCDEDRKKNSPRTKGLLFGIPVSIKESFGQKGHPRTGGCCALIDDIPTQDSVLVSLVKAEGAIPFVRTNLPQVLYTCVSTNRIYGETTNPWDKTRSSGGSSGGEGSIVAARASPLGFGSDIGGSIRIPSAYCGVYGFKPTGGRTSLAGHAMFGPTGRGQINILATSGPIGRSVNDLELASQCLITEKMQSGDPLMSDFTLPCAPWKHDQTFHKEGAKLTFGYFETIDFIRASKPARRAVRKTVQKLKAAGHNVVQLDMSFATEAILNHIRLISSDDFKLAYDMTKPEKLIDEYTSIALMGTLPTGVKKVIASILTLLGQSILAGSAKSLGRCHVKEYLTASSNQQDIQKLFIKQFQDLKLDAVISPGFAIPAMKTKSADMIATTACYTFLYNFLGVPAGSLPVTRVQAGEDIYDEKVGNTQQIYEKEIAKDMKGSVGMPMNVQVVTLPWQDEKCIAAMRVVEKLIPFYKENSFPV